MKPMRRASAQKRPDLPLALAMTPDRSLSLLGLYVRFKDRLWIKKRSRDPFAEPGEMGVIVQDVEGICSEGQLAVHTVRCREFGVSYLPVSKRILEIQRGT